MRTKVTCCQRFSMQKLKLWNDLEKLWANFVSTQTNLVWCKFNFDSHHIVMLPFDCLICGHKCRSQGGLCRHTNSRHPHIPPLDASAKHKRIYHQFLNGMYNVSASWRTCCIDINISTARPCTEDGTFLNEFDYPAPPPTPPEPSEKQWAPFQDQLGHDFAYYHYVQLQSSKSDINEGLDLWRAAVIQHCLESEVDDAIPWHSADDLYQTIDQIQEGGAPFKSIKLCYNGPKPPTPHHWMEEEYELNVRDVLLVMHNPRLHDECVTCASPLWHPHKLETWEPFFTT